MGNKPEPTFRQCRDCDFWVTRRERFCPNCSIEKPFVPYSQSRFSKSLELPERVPALNVGYASPRGAFVGGLASGLLTLASIFFAAPALMGGQILLSVPIVALGVVLGAVAGWFVDQSNQSSRRGRPRRAAENLCQYERQVRDHLRDLASRRSQLAAMSGGRIHELEPGAVQAASAALASADATLSERQSAYDARSRKIEALRLRNVLTAAFTDLAVLGLPRLGRRVAAIQASLERAADLPALDCGGYGDETSDRKLRALLSLGEQVRQACVAREAVLEIAAISSAEPDLAPLSLPPELVAGMHELDARLEIDRLGRAVRDLEVHCGALTVTESLARAHGGAND